MADFSGKRAKDPIHSAYQQWVTSRKDWENVIDEIFDIASGFEFVLAVISNFASETEENLVIKVNREFGAQDNSKVLEYMGEFSMKHFEFIEKHIKNNHNELSLYRIKDQKVATPMHVPVNSNIFEVRSDVNKKAGIFIIFQKPRVPSEMELMLRRIQKKVLQKKKAWFF